MYFEIFDGGTLYSVRIPRFKSIFGPNIKLAGDTPVEECISEFFIRCTNGKYLYQSAYILVSNIISHKCLMISLLARSTILFSS